MAEETRSGKPPEPCKKCGGTGLVDPPEKLRKIFGGEKFVCDRCGGAKTEPPSD